MARALQGWLILDKPLGLGSTNGVSAVKRALRDGGYAKVKVGHGGTLDPLATGVLPIALGEATKLAGRMLDATKTYDFTVAFGVQTDTLDAEGRVVATSEVRPDAASVSGVLGAFTGAIEQMPPAFSALKIDGQRAYDLARAGEAVVLSARSVEVLDLALLNADADSATLRATVSKGTYIRSLARDIALALGTVGHVTMLRRVRAGPFGLEGAISLDFLDAAAKGQRLEQVILPLEAGLDGIPALAIDADQATALRQGRRVAGQGTGLHLARLGDVPVALVEGDGDAFRVVRGFNP